MAMKVVGGSANVALAKELAAQLGVENVPVSFEKHPGGFPDGERYVRVAGDVDGEDVVVVQSTHPDEKTVELFLLHDAVREAGAARVVTVVPYFGYGRQDRVFEPGESVSARALARRIEVETDEVLTVGLHNRAVLAFFSVPARDVSGMPPIGRYLQSAGVDFVLAPDENAVGHAKEVAAIVDVPWDFLEKERIDGYTVKVTPKALAVEGKVVAIVDDVISTGGTMATAAKALKAQGARRVLAGCLHGLFVDNALDKLKVCDEVFSTDTVPNPMAKVSVAAEIADALRVAAA
jgi:ribose-phosphate pyrophosphokinase